MYIQLQSGTNIVFKLYLLELASPFNPYFVAGPLSFDYLNSIGNKPKLKLNPYSWTKVGDFSCLLGVCVYVLYVINRNL